jgi:hypothetical protein
VDDLIKRLLVESSASPAEIEDVQAVFARAGFDVTADPAYERRSAALLPWIVEVTLAAPIAAFFVAFGTKAGEDAYSAVKSWAREMFDARRASGSGEGSLAISDSEGTNLILSSGIPERALDDLRQLEWPAHAGEYLIWDDHRGWHDPMKR